MKKDKIKILHAIRQGKIGGGETHVLDLVQNLNKDQYESTVLAFTDGPLIDELKRLNIATKVILTEKPFDIFVWQQVLAFIRIQKFDIIHAHGTRAQSNVFWAAKKLRLPLIYTVHGWSFHPNQNSFVHKIRSFSEKFLVNKADATICVSENNLQEGKQHFKMSQSFVIKNGINFKKFDSKKLYKNVRSEFNVNEETILVGYIARITDQKDPLTFIRAIAKVPKQLPLKFLIVGDGDLKPEAVRLASELNLNDKIIFSGFRQDVPDLLNAVDIYCLPSLWEGLPIGLLEAMAMKKATIASGVNGTKEVVTDGVNGLLISPKNEIELAEKIVLLATNKNYREALGKAAENYVKNTYDISLMTNKIEHLYQLKLKN